MPFDPFYLVVAVVFLTMVTILVAAHELGHYLFARLFKMGVEEFAIGFGRKPIWTWMRKKYSGADGDEETTAFTIRPWPLGGFVKIKGMVPEEDGSEINVPGGFYSKPPLQRFVVLLAGPVFSILAGWVVLIPVLMFYGMKEPLNEPVFGGFAQDGAAAQAGLKVGDRVISIDAVPVATFSDLVKKTQDSKGRPMEFLIRREGKELRITLAAKLDDKPSPVLGPDLKRTDAMARQYKLGAGFKEVRVPRPFGQAVGEALMMPVQVVDSLLGMLTQRVKFSENVGGPASIVAVTAASAREGIWDILFLAGALSISLGIFNLLPISPLDGGQMTVAFVELLRRGKRLSFRVQNWVAGIGVTLVLILVVSVLAVDFNRFFPGAKEKGKPATVESKK